MLQCSFDARYHASRDFPSVRLAKFLHGARANDAPFEKVGPDSRGQHHQPILGLAKARETCPTSHSSQERDDDGDPVLGVTMQLLEVKALRNVERHVSREQRNLQPHDQAWPVPSAMISRDFSYFANASKISSIRWASNGGAESRDEPYEEAFGPRRLIGIQREGVFLGISRTIPGNTVRSNVLPQFGGGENSERCERGEKQCKTGNHCLPQHTPSTALPPVRPQSCPTGSH